MYFYSVTERLIVWRKMMFGDREFGMLLFGALAASGEPLNPSISWNIQCKPQSDWEEIPVTETTKECTDGS